MACSIVGVFLLFLYSPYRQIKQLDDQAKEDTNALVLKDKSIHELQTALEELKFPRLRAVIENRNIHEFRAFPGVASIALVISITNAGAASIADHWALKVKLPDGRLKTGVQLPIPSRLTFRGASGDQVYSEKDALYNKTMKNPIQKGQKVTGVLWFLLEGTTSKEVVNSTMDLTFKDFLEKDYVAENRAIYHGAPPVYFPGLEQQIKEGLFVK